MTDRERLINTLIGIAMTLDTDNLPDDAQAVMEAVSVLKAQQPMKPKVKHFELHYASYDEYENRVYCPKCGIQFIQQVNYCPNCGQGVEWDANISR